MTEREIREAREQWDEAHSRWSCVARVIDEMRGLEYELRRECERLAAIIAEHDHAPIMVVEPIAAGEATQKQPIVITEDDGGPE